MKTNKDEILDEVRRIREKHAAAHGYDLDRIVADLRVQEKSARLTVVTLPPREPARPRQRRGV
ncbi:hypothetical protein MYX65_01555 [Acidobacteria bacterium AH-259-L09]|nr:hypothetical protein [Acidobacteria bacterium AH-259-L09]